MGFLATLTGGTLGGDTESFIYKDSRGKRGCVEGPVDVHKRIGGSPKHIKKNICCNDRGYSNELNQMTRDSLGVKVFMRT